MYNAIDDTREQQNVTPHTAYYLQQKMLCK